MRNKTSEPTTYHDPARSLIEGSVPYRAEMERRYLAAIEDAKQNPLDETVEDGKYILAGHLVNAFGEAITEPEPGP